MHVEPASEIRHRIIENFSKAARHYDAQAGLQRDVADALLSSLPGDVSPIRVVDVGCGTGYVAAQLQSLYPLAMIAGVDPAAGMLTEAARRYGSGRLSWQLGEAEHLPFEAASLDMIVSSLAIQWCPSPAEFLAEAERTLRPGGWLAFTTLMDGSLGELKKAFESLEDQPRVNDFLTITAMERHLYGSKLICHRLTYADHYAFHTDVSECLGALKAVGASTLSSRRSRHGLMGRERWARLSRALETFRTTHGLPTTYRVALVLMQKPMSFPHNLVV